MKVCIMGPLKTESKYGGVRIFDEALGKGFVESGHNVFVCSTQKTTEVVTTLRFKHISVFNINRVFTTEKPDLIICSLQYAIYHPFVRMKHCWVYFLHGFFGISGYGIFKGVLGILYQKIFAEKCDRIYANSNFTYVVNSNVIGLRVDKTIHIGVSEEIIEMAQKKKTVCSQNSKKVLFAGRLSKSKKIDVLIQAVCKLYERGLDFTVEIIGNGSEKENLLRIIKNEQRIKIFDSVNQDTLFQMEQEAEVFVSLCPFESYGMAFFEALMAGCKIVCPTTGGQLELLELYNNKVIKVNPMDVSSVADGIKKALEMQQIEISTSNFREQFSYKTTVRKILDDINPIIQEFNQK